VEEAWPELGVKRRSYLAQSQLFPQLHSLLSFIGQFLPVVLQFGLSAAKDTVQSAATRIENKIFV
jgi:hypothetical protein